MQASTSWPVVRIRRLRFGCTTRGCPHTWVSATRESWPTWGWVRMAGIWWAQVWMAAYSCGVSRTTRTLSHPAAGARRSVAWARVNSRRFGRGSCHWRSRCRSEKKTFPTYRRRRRWCRCCQTVRPLPVVTWVSAIVAAVGTFANRRHPSDDGLRCKSCRHREG